MGRRELALRVEINAMAGLVQRLRVWILRLGCLLAHEGRAMPSLLTVAVAVGVSRGSHGIPWRDGVRGGVWGRRLWVMFILMRLGSG